MLANAFWQLFHKFRGKMVKPEALRSDLHRDHTYSEMYLPDRMEAEPILKKIKPLGAPRPCEIVLQPCLFAHDLIEPSIARLSIP